MRPYCLKCRKNTESKNPEVVTTKNDLDKVCFQHDMIYEEFEDLTRRTASDKILCDVYTYYTRVYTYYTYIQIIHNIYILYIQNVYSFIDSI